MILSRKDINVILDVLSKFPEVNTFNLEQDSSSGIGSTTTMKFDVEMNEVAGEFSVEIDSVEDW